MHPLTQRFAALFAGLPLVYGIYDLSKVIINESSGKNVGQATTLDAPVTPDVWSKHLRGEEGVGIVPIRDDGTCVFGAIDIDSYRGFDPSSMARQVVEANLPLVVCRSKSGGAHCYLFAAAPVKAVFMQARLKEAAQRLNLSPKVEIFPKQSELNVDRGDSGSWINMPYRDAAKTDRYAYGPDGELTAEQFLDLAENMKQPPEFFERPIPRLASEYFTDGPPCLERLAAAGRIGEGSRNETLFHIGVYQRLKTEAEGGSLTAELDNWNHLMFNPPLGSEEVANVKKSLNRKKYQFKCASEPFASMCDGAVCQMRKYGVGKTSERGESTDALPIGFPALTALEKLNTEPPTWYLTANGKQISLTTDELLSGRLARKRMLEVINTLIPTPTEQSWERMVQELMKRVTLIEVPKGEGGSQRDEFWGFVEQFCRRSAANDRVGIRNGLPWTEDGYTWFTIHNLTNFLARNGFRAEQHTIYRWLHELGARRDHWKLQGDPTRVWGVPAYEELEDPPEYKDETPF
ncbi:MAG: TOTE conflict system archaeo-eukaryotic primase domain-containing protein [Acidimicrobiales bacterium]